MQQNVDTTGYVEVTHHTSNSTGDVIAQTIAAAAAAPVQEQPIEEPNEVEPEIDLDQYVKDFETIGANNDALAAMAAELRAEQLSQKKVAVMARYIDALQAQNTKIYELLCTMNNIFGK